jgi:hypothetical protein
MSSRRISRGDRVKFFRQVEGPDGVFVTIPKFGVVLDSDGHWTTVELDDREIVDLPIERIVKVR